MCGRYAFSHSVADMQALFDVANPAELAGEARYNIAPTQPVTLVFRDRQGVRRAGRARWGLVPGWVKDPREWKASAFNARSEDAATRPAFRQAFRRGRVLIPASGFYEWKRENGAKVPYHIRASDGAPLAFAGLMDIWRGKERDDRLVSCSILTAPAAGPIRDLHDRMPVVVAPNEFAEWLGGEDGSAALKRIVAAGSARDLEIYPVSSAVNSARDDRPEFAEPVA